MKTRTKTCGRQVVQFCLIARWAITRTGRCLESSWGLTRSFSRHQPQVLLSSSGNQDFGAATVSSGVEGKLDETCLILQSVRMVLLPPFLPCTLEMVPVIRSDDSFLTVNGERQYGQGEQSTSGFPKLETNGGGSTSWLIESP